MIKAIYELGLSQAVRAGIIYISLGLVFVVAAFYCKRTGMNTKRTLTVVGISYLLMIACALPNSISAVSGEDFLLDILYVPLTMIHGLAFCQFMSVPLSRLMGLDWRRVNDYTAVGTMLCQGISHFGCIFLGCCHGYESPFGVYNPLTGTTMLPVQIFDGLSCIALAVIFAVILRRRSYDAGGLIYPVMLVSYGVIRLLWDLLRDGVKIAGPFTLNNLHCFFMIGVGIVSLWLVASMNKERAAARAAGSRGKK